MTLMKRKQEELEWPAWFGRPFGDLSGLWTSLDETLKVEEYDADGQHVVRAEMPGIDPDKDVDITIADGRLHLRADRRSETKTEDTKGYRTEFWYGSFERTLRLPTGATEADVTATYTDGILEVRVPIDTAFAESRRIPVVRS
jgi:HSP20 family protein